MGYFLCFYLTNSLKNQNLKKWKNTWRYHHFTQVHQKSWSYAPTVPEIQHVTDVIVIFHFRLFFALLPPNSPKIKILKKWKKRLEISSFYIGVTFYICDQMVYGSRDMCTTNRQTNGLKKRHVQVGAPPRNLKKQEIRNILIKTN